MLKNTIAWFLAVGGSLASGAAAPPTFTRDVAPILFNNCVVCHRAGEVAPFPLLTYDDARKHAKQMARVTSDHLMPPWKAAPDFGAFADERRLTGAQIDLLKDWFDAGAAEGNAADLPPLPQFTSGWQLGEPDLILEPAEDYHLAAEGRDIYRCFVVPSGLTTNRHIAAMEVRPGNRRVVHHVIAHIDTSGKARELDAADPGPGYSTFGGVGFRSQGSIGGWAPGNFPSRLPDATGIQVPKEADIVLQVHYHKSGKPETDRTRVGLYFAKGPVDKRVRTIPLTKLPLRIPAGDSNFVVHASLPVLFNATLLRVMPHMHLIGREMTVTATLPDGTVQPLVKVPDWDFNWQTTYTFQKPLHLPAGTRVDLEARYDNSANNPLNPHHPPRLVTFGEQTTDEMCLAFLTFTVDAEHLTKGIVFDGFSRSARQGQRMRDQ